MAVREILRMGDPRLLQVADSVTDFGSQALRGLIDDMFDTMRAAGGVGLAAPQIGVSLQVVIFGFERSERYPEAPPVPLTVLINPQIVPLGDAEARAWQKELLTDEDGFQQQLRALRQRLNDTATEATP